MRSFLGRIIAFFALTTLLLGLASCGDGTGTDTTLAAIQKRGVLRVAIFADKPPFGYVDGQGHYQGYDVVLARRLAKDLLGDENKVEFVLTEAQNRVDVLKANRVDITLANFTITKERRREVDFALPYMKTAIGLVSPKRVPIKSIAALQNKILLVNKGTTAELWFTQKEPKIKLLSFEQNTETFNALKDGRGAALAHDNTLLFAWVKNNPDFVVSIEQVGPNDLIAPAVKKGNDTLKNWLDEEIKGLTAAGFFLQDYKQTVAPFYGPGIDPRRLVLTLEELKSE